MKKIRKKLFVLEYKGDYTGGTLVIICNNKKEINTIYKSYLKEVGSNNYHKLETNETKVDLYKIGKISYNNKSEDGSYTKKQIEDILKDYSFTVQTLIGKKLDNKDYQYEDKTIRLDWIMDRIYSKDALVSVEEFTIMTNRPNGVISDTYYCA